MSVIVAEAGSDKSLLLDRLMQRAIARHRDKEGAPLPVFIDATRVRGELRELTAAGSGSLVRRFSGDDRVLDAALRGPPESVRKAVRRPLFAARGWDRRGQLVLGKRS